MVNYGSVFVGGGSPMGGGGGSITQSIGSLTGRQATPAILDDIPLIEGDSTATSDILRSMIEKGEFVILSSEDAISKLGHVEPMSGGHPNGIAEALLRCVPSARSGYMLNISGTGLFYALPKMFSKPDRVRTTYAGLALLDHWAEKHKRFAPFVDAFAPQWARDQIASDCVDLGFGKMPKWIKDELDHCEKIARRHHDKVMRELAVKQARYQAELQKMYADQQLQAQQYQQSLEQQMMMGQTSFSGTGRTYSDIVNQRLGKQTTLWK